MEQYRHELKYEINAADAAEIRQRLRCIAATDPHAKNGRYKIRSLYFDTPTNRALYEKLDGVNRREKFRIRYYNGDLSRICLEKKSKYCNLSAKRSEVITKEQARAFAAGEFLRMPDMGALPENENTAASRENDRGLYPGTLHIRTGQCPGDAGL